MKRAELVIKSTEKLIEVENIVGMALSEVAQFTGDLERARIDSKLSAMIGQEALLEAVEAVTLLTQARGAMVRLHGRLDEVKTRIGCRTVAGSGLTDKGDEDVPVGPPRGQHIKRVV